MKGSKTIIVAIVVVILGFPDCIQPDRHPGRGKKPHAAAGGYGGGDASLHRCFPLLTCPVTRV